MKTTDTLLEALKEWMTTANPGLVTREDLVQVETRLDELSELLDAIEARLDAREAEPTP